jgi:hypothetical protein
MMAVVLPAGGASAAPAVANVVGRDLPGLPSAVDNQGLDRQVRRDGDVARVSQQVRTPIRFTMVGFTLPTGAQLDFRTSVDGVAWTSWQTTTLDGGDGPDPGSAEQRQAAQVARNAGRAAGVATAAMWVGDASYLQTRIAGEGRRATPEQAVAHLVDSDGLGRSALGKTADALGAAWRGVTTPAPAQAGTGQPAIVSRAQWGADESWRRNGPSYSSTLKAGILHHTAGSNTYTREQAPAVLRGDYYYHTKVNGWSDLGYNYVVDRYGTVYEGRYGGITANVLGAHAGGFNTSTFGVSIMGNFTDGLPPKAARAAVVRLVAWRQRLASIDPLGTTVLTSAGSSRYSAGVQVRLNTLAGHRDVSATACPGDALYPRMGSLRQRIAERIAELEKQAPAPFRLLMASQDTGTVSLQGKTVRGKILVSADQRPAGTRGVDFWLDRRFPSAAPQRVAQSEPYNFGWLRTRALTDGGHTITARVRRSDGTSVEVTAQFQVQNRFTVRIDTGGRAHKDRYSRLWSADTGSVQGTPHVVGTPIAGTSIDGVYRSRRVDPRGYRIPVPRSGRYEVRLHFAELYYTRAGERVFGALAEGRRVLGKLDLVAEVGPLAAHRVIVPVDVDDGYLNLHFSASVGAAAVNAIEVIGTPVS